MNRRPEIDIAHMSVELGQYKGRYLDPENHHMPILFPRKLHLEIVFGLPTRENIEEMTNEIRSFLEMCIKPKTVESTSHIVESIPLEEGRSL